MSEPPAEKDADLLGFGGSARSIARADPTNSSSSDQRGRADRGASGREPGETEGPAASDPQHDPTGLDLARSIADSVGALQRRRKRRRTQRPSQVDPVRSGAAPDDRDPKSLGRALDHLVEAKGWSTDLSVRALLARWPVLVGPTNAAHSWPESYADTVLTVRTESTVWATSLRTIAPQLVAKLNDQLGDGTVSRVKVLGPQGPSWKKGPLSVRDGRGPRDTYG
jgi:predicted nucleic acid-binding Zn ribbon protein